MRRRPGQAVSRRARDAKRRPVLEKALAQNPAPSRHEVGKRLRVSEWTLAGQFYELSAAIRTRHRKQSSSAACPEPLAPEMPGECGLPRTIERVAA